MVNPKIRLPSVWMVEVLQEKQNRENDRYDCMSIASYICHMHKACRYSKIIYCEKVMDIFCNIYIWITDMMIYLCDIWRMIKFIDSYENTEGCEYFWMYWDKKILYSCNMNHNNKNDSPWTRQIWLNHVNPGVCLFFCYVFSLRGWHVISMRLYPTQ